MSELSHCSHTVIITGPHARRHPLLQTFLVSANEDGQIPNSLFLVVWETRHAALQELKEEKRSVDKTGIQQGDHETTHKAYWYFYMEHPVSYNSVCPGNFVDVHGAKLEFDLFFRMEAIILVKGLLKVSR